MQPRRSTRLQGPLQIDVAGDSPVHRVVGRLERRSDLHCERWFLQNFRCNQPAPIERYAPQRRWHYMGRHGLEDFRERGGAYSDIPDAVSSPTGLPGISGPLTSQSSAFFSVPDTPWAYSGLEMRNASTWASCTRRRRFSPHVC